MGPHGLLIGATGSGKSELLRTLVLGLAMTHPPEVLNFILTDFKGGATFTRLDELPHTSAVITNLAEELTLVDRMQDAISGEVNRRQELLRAAGNYASVRDYDAARAAGVQLAPLPTLFVVVDEFSELLSAKPDFIDLFVMIGRVGRSLGVHLLLASQRLEEGKLRGLDTYLSYRIGLKTFSAAESRVVLGVPDAYELPTSPGNGYLKYDTESMVRFKAAYVSGPYRSGASGVEPSATAMTWSSYALRGESAEADDTVSDRATVQPSTQSPSVLDVVLGRLKGHGGSAHQVWLPPLDAPPSLDALIPGLTVDPALGLTAPQSPLRGALVAPMGLLDRPFEQRREPLALDFSGAAGHGVIVGGPQSGKSSTLRSIMTSLALLNTPTEVQFYCLDFGGGALSALAPMPHVGVVASRLQRDLVHRTVSQLARLLDRREAEFAAAGIDSVAEWRRRRRSDLLPSDGYGDVFLVIDGLGVLREQYDELETLVTSIAARGLNFGVHVLLAATRWAEVRPALRDLLGTRLELRLGDPTDSEVPGRKGALVPLGAPGRGLTSQGLHFLSAVSRIDGVQSAAELSAGLADLLTQLGAAWAGLSAVRVELLPAHLDFAQLLTRVPAGPPPAGVLIGMDEDFEPLFWDPDRDQHLVVVGDSQTGKTSLLAALVAGFAARTTSNDAQFVLLDPRRGLLELLDADRVAMSAVVSSEAASMFGGAAAALTQRIPGSDVTPTQLRERSWWSGPHMVVVVDDLELAGSSDILAPFSPLLPYSADIGLHLLVARSARGVGRAMYEPTFGGLRDAGAPFIVLDAPKDEGTVVGTRKVANLPPGRGRWVSRRRGRVPAADRRTRRSRSAGAPVTPRPLRMISRPRRMISQL